MTRSEPKSSAVFLISSVTTKPEAIEKQIYKGTTLGAMPVEPSGENYSSGNMIKECLLREDIAFDSVLKHVVARRLPAD